MHELGAQGAIRPVAVAEARGHPCHVRGFYTPAEGP